MEDIVFLCDQVVEAIARLHTFASTRVNGPLAHPDIGDDVERVTELLARRDMLVLAASMRNFVEATQGKSAAKASKMATSEIFISGGPPFFRDTKAKINFYQCLSRILHSIDLRIFRTASDYFASITRNIESVFQRLRDYQEQGGDPSEPHEPLIRITTEQEGLTFVRLPYVISSSCEVLGQLSDKLEKEKIFLQRDYR